MTRSLTTLMAGMALATMLALAAVPASAQSGSASLVDPGTIGAFTGPVAVEELSDQFWNQTDTQTDYSRGLGVSGDGNVLFGASGTPSGAAHAFAWTAADGFTDLGYLGSDPKAASTALAASADGSTIVGMAQQAPGSGLTGFIWTKATGMLPTPQYQGFGIMATGISADASVIVGLGWTPGTNDRAMRWTASSGWVILGTIGGYYSDALGVSADGNTVVGSGAAASGQRHALRWTQAGGMIDLGTLGNANGESDAVAASADGSVIVGKSVTPDGSAYHAVTWSGTTIADLGTINAVHGNSTAYGVSGNGNVIVGSSVYDPSGALHAFVWTQPTGMQDLNGLLSAAGVNMTGVNLTIAHGVSTDGNVVAGQGTFPGTGAHAYLARIGGSASGVTTPDSVVRSIQTLASTHQAQMVYQMLASQTYTGLNEQINCNACGGAYASFGSFNLSTHGRHALNEDWMVMGGFGYGRYQEKGAEVSQSFSAAVTLHYSPHAMGHSRPYFEIGAAAAPSQTVAYSRTYDNGAGTATGMGRTKSSFGSAYVKAGWVAMPARNLELGAAISLARVLQHQGSYAEATGSANPFDAVYTHGTDSMNIVTASASATRLIGKRWEVTADVSVSRSYDAKSGVHAMVSGAGPQEAAAQNFTWAQPGLRIGYRAGNNVTIDAFVNATIGPKAIGTGVHGGIGVSMRF